MADSPSRQTKTVWTIRVEAECDVENQDMEEVASRAAHVEFQIKNALAGVGLRAQAHARIVGPMKVDRAAL